MTVETKKIKDLRAKTGAGIMDCKKALEDTNGDISEAEELLRQKGVSSAAKKVGRITDQGVVESYIHNGGKIGALVEVNCETDFVARTSDFTSLAHDLAMQVAAMSPQFINKEELIDKNNQYDEQSCLLEQPFIKDPSKRIQDVINETVGKLGENIEVKRFTRFSLGE
mgnify:FL=1